MNITVNGCDIFYQRHLGGRPVILLHGWGGTHKLMDGLFNALAKCGSDVISVDLPGFGFSPPPPAHFTTDDYAECIRQLIAALKLSGVTVVGHSFGGRLAILLGGENEVDALVLISSAGVKPRFSLRKKIRQIRYKRAKKRGRDLSKYGSNDYRALSGDMRRVFVSVVNRHLDAELKKINVPTLLIWGKKDKETPLYMAKKMLKNIKDCGLVKLCGGHFAYLEQHKTTAAAVKSFIF